MRIARRQEHFVFGDRDAADTAVSRRLVGANARFPNQIARLPIKRLDDVARARQVHDAVVNDGRRLVRTRVVHGPCPLQSQLLHVVARNLMERAVAVALVVAPEDEPILRGRVPEHLGRYRDVVFDLALNADTTFPGGASSASAGRRPRAEHGQSNSGASFSLSNTGCRRPQGNFVNGRRLG